MKLPNIDLNDSTMGDSLSAFAHRLATDERLSQIPLGMPPPKQQPRSQLSHSMRFHPYERRSKRYVKFGMARPESRICKELTQARLAHAQNCTRLFVLLVELNDLKSQMTETEWNEGAWKSVAWEIKDTKRDIDLFDMTVHDLKRELGVKLSEDEDIGEEAKEVLLAHLSQQRHHAARERDEGFQRMGANRVHQKRKAHAVRPIGGCSRTCIDSCY